MYIEDDGIRLNARLDMPLNCGSRCPLVILIHGFTGNMEERHITALSDMMNRIGYATLRVDMYGHGGSGGSFRSHTLFKWLTNAMTVIDYARELEWVSGIYLCGHSQGGLTVMMAAAMKRETVKGLIPMSPAVMIPEEARKGILLGLPFDPDHIPEHLADPVHGWELDGNYLRVAQTIYPESIIGRYSGPVLLIHGDKDVTVPVSCSISAAGLYSNVRLVLIPGDTHGYDYHLDQVTAAAENWLLQRKTQENGWNGRPG